MSVSATASARFIPFIRFPADDPNSPCVFVREARRQGRPFETDPLTVHCILLSCSSASLSVICNHSVSSSIILYQTLVMNEILFFRATLSEDLAYFREKMQHSVSKSLRGNLYETRGIAVDSLCKS